MRRVAVIGGGPAGMMAAFAASESGNDVTLFEKNEKLGKKLFITGKGRCNLTNAADITDFFPEIVRNPKFLYSALYSYTNEDIISFFRDRCRVPLKTERGNRVFPESDHSSDIIRAMERTLEGAGVQIRLHERIEGVVVKEGAVSGIVRQEGKEEPFDAVILCSGGKSYPTTGSDGTSFGIAEDLGHTVTPLYPSLVPLITKENFGEELAGLSLKNVRLTIFKGKKELGSEFGELLFTHSGISGPIALTLSCIASPLLMDGAVLRAELDLKDALSEEVLTKRIIRETEKTPNQELKSLMTRLLPKSLGNVLMKAAGLAPETKLHSLTKEMRGTLIRYLKAFPLTLIDTAGFKEAIITCGGVKVSEIDPGTMESKLVRGLYFAGEMIDCDAHTGGYNLQIAWSTGHLAGSSI